MATYSQIQSCVNSITTSCCVEDILTTTACVNNVTENRSIAVDFVSDLPDLNTTSITPGTVFYVRQYNINVVAGLGNWVSLDGRVVRRDTTYGALWSWGCNNFGQLGTNNTISRSSPVSVVGEFTNWREVSAGRYHSLGVKRDGTLWAWGQNNLGRLGDGTVTSRSSPVSVIGGFTDWCQISAGDSSSAGVRCNGTIWTWGSGTSGMLGSGINQPSSSPISVAGGFTDWCQVSVGYFHMLGLRTNGTLWSWGGNSSGQLGHSTATTASVSSPVSVLGGFTDWCQVSAGWLHSLAIRQNGTLWAWGGNSNGILGDNTTTSRSSPVSVIGGFTDWCQGIAAPYHSLGLRTNGTLWAWGSNSFGQFGDNTVTNKSSPVSVVGGITNWCGASVGCTHSVAITQSGVLWAWGSNSYGQLGDNTTLGRSSPVSVVGGLTRWGSVSAGSRHNIGILSFL